MRFESALERVDSDARLAGDRGERFARLVASCSSPDIESDVRRPVRSVDLNAGSEKPSPGC